MKKIFTLLFFISCAQILFAQSGSVKLVSFSTGYSLPLGIENCGDNRLFIVQKTGQIIICDTTGKKVATPFLDISDRILANGGEQGLLGLAFDPKYTSNGIFYVNYINRSGNTQISRFKASAKNKNQANKGSEKFILQIAQPYDNHNGGCIRFGQDGYLYIGMGDGGSGGDPQNNAQNPASLLGKILRLNVKGKDTYTIPANNPFVDSANYKKEIWALGVRNPWRFSFDAINGSLLIADVGQDLWEEVDLQNVTSKGGENYGWRCYEGNHAYNTSGCKPQSAYTFPVYEYQHSSVTGDCSITGGFVYRGKRYQSLYGKYFFTDYCSGIIRTLTFNGSAATKADVFTGDKYAYTSFGEDANHELFITSYATGSIYRITPSSALASNETGNSLVSMMVYPNPANKAFSVKYKTSKAEECVVTVYGANGRQVYSAKKVSVAGENTWKVVLPDFVRGNCYVTISSLSGSLVRENIVIQ